MYLRQPQMLLPTALQHQAKFRAPQQNSALAPYPDRGSIFFRIEFPEIMPIYSRPQAISVCFFQAFGEGQLEKVKRHFLVVTNGISDPKISK